MTSVPIVEERLKAIDRQSHIEDIENSDANRAKPMKKDSMVKELPMPVAKYGDPIKIEHLREFMKSRQRESQKVDPDTAKQVIKAANLNSQFDRAKEAGEKLNISNVKGYIRNNESNVDFPALNSYKNPNGAPPKQSKGIESVSIAPDRPDDKKANVANIEGLKDFVDVVKLKESGPNPLKFVYQK